MTRRARWRSAGALLAAAAVLVAVPAAGASAPSRERAVIGAGALSVQIDDLEPAIPEPGDVLVVRGTVTNTSDAPVRSVSAGLRLSPTPMGNRDEIPEVLAGSGLRTGQPVPGSVIPVSDELVPGATQTFELSADVDELGLTTAGAYVTGAEALGDSGAGVVRQDMDRTFLPWWPEGATVEPLLLTTIWPLSGPPLRDAQGILLTEDAAVQMSPAGRLTRLLDAAAADPGSVSLVVDPEAVEAAADLADGYRVRTPQGTVEPGTRSQEVGVWLADLTAALTAPGVDAAGGMYAWLDVDAARRGKVLGTALRQRGAIDRATAEILGRSLPSTVVLAPGGVLRPRSLDTLSARGVRAVVLSDTAAPLAEPTYFTASGNMLIPTREGDMPALLADSRIAATLALPMDTMAEQTAVRQALLAQTLVTAGELPDSQQLLVAGLDPDWDPPVGAAPMVRAALTSAPWVRPTSLRAALARDPGALARVQVAPSEEQVAQELPAAHVARVRSQYTDLREYAGVVPDPSIDPAGDPESPHPAARVLVPGPPGATSRPHRARRQADRGAHRVSACGVQRIDHHLRSLGDDPDHGGEQRADRRHDRPGADVHAHAAVHGRPDRAVRDRPGAAHVGRCHRPGGRRRSHPRHDPDGHRAGGALRRAWRARGRVGGLRQRRPGAGPGGARRTAPGRARPRDPPGTSAPAHSHGTAGGATPVRDPG